MKYSKGDLVRINCERDSRYNGMTGKVTHTKEFKGIEHDMALGETIFPKNDFDYTVSLKHSSGITFVFHVYENEINIANRVDGSASN